MSIDDDTARDLMAAVLKARRPSDDDDMFAHAVAVAAGLMLTTDNAMHAARSALSIARRHVVTRRLRSEDGMDRILDLDVTDADVAAAVDTALRQAAGRQGRLNVGHHGPADTIARYTLPDLIDIAMRAVPADRSTMARKWLDAERMGKGGKRAVLTGDALAWDTAMRAAITATGDADPLGEPHPRKGSVYAPSTHTDAPAAPGPVTVTRDGVTITRDMTDAEHVACQSHRDETVAPEHAAGDTARSSDLLNVTDHTPTVTAFNGETTYDASHLAGRSRKPVVSPRSKRSDNGPTTTDRGALGMTGTR